MPIVAPFQFHTDKIEPVVDIDASSLLGTCLGSALRYVPVRVDCFDGTHPQPSPEMAAGGVGLLRQWSLLPPVVACGDVSANSTDSSE